MNKRAKLVQSVVLLAIGLLALLDALDNPPVQSLRGIDIALLVAAGMAFGAALMTLLGRDPRASWSKSSLS
jgi:hypothetical protein